MILLALLLQLATTQIQQTAMIALNDDPDEVQEVRDSLPRFIADSPNAGYEADQIKQVIIDLAAFDENPDALHLLQLTDDWEELKRFDTNLEKLHVI